MRSAWEKFIARSRDGTMEEQEEWRKIWIKR